MVVVSVSAVGSWTSTQIQRCRRASVCGLRRSSCEREQPQSPISHSTEERAAYRRTPIDQGQTLNRETEDKKQDAHKDPDVQIPKFPKISHELIHPFLHPADPWRFVTCVFGKLVVLLHIPTR